MSSIPSEDLVRDLRQVAKKLGNNFSAKDYRNAGGSFSPKTIAERFGGWEKALLQIRASKIKEVAKERAQVQLSGGFSETLLAALQKPTSLVELANIADTSPGRVMEQIVKLRRSGVDVH